MAKQLAFYFDSSVCTNCKACQIACQDKNDLPASMRWRRVLQYGGGNWVLQDNVMTPNNIFTYSTSTSCMHCAEPICAEVCPAAAITKGDNGIVNIDANKCIGCRYCQWACPYGAPQFNTALGVMTKCNFCQDNLAAGKNPACVDACVMRALDFGELDVLQARYGTLNAIEPLPSGTITKPSFVITPHLNAQESGKGTGKILNLPEEV
jgi:anaerobic dimethyl sulfoxide reductase subunit B (iron-sulfur subunit)